MAIDRLAFEVCRIDDEIDSLIRRFARVENDEVRRWFCELLADLNERKQQLIEDRYNDGTDSMD
jgi:hypothetical protein